MVRHEESAGAEAHAARLHQRLGDEEVGRRMGLPRRGVMLADPRLAEAELVCPPQLLQVPLMTVEEAALRWMRRHREQSVVHAYLRLYKRASAGRAPAPRRHAARTALSRVRSSRTEEQDAWADGH